MEKELTLPSAPLYREEGFDGKVVIRPLKTKDEKFLCVANTSKALQDVLSRCIVKPESFDLSKLTSPDIMFLLIQLRIISYGNTYDITVHCDNCNKKVDVNIDLDSLKLDNLQEDFVEPIEVILPVSQQRVGIRLLRQKDIYKIQEKAASLRKKFPQGGNHLYFQQMLSLVDNIDGKKLSDAEKEAVVGEWIGRDSAYFNQKVDEIEIGYDLKQTEVCPFCGEEIEFVLPIEASFFRPLVR